jgi:small-conductance mechanosensitive channel/CRP-like cAMP-binding protein
MLMRTELGIAAAAAVGLAIMIMALDPASRRMARNMIVVVLLALLGELGALIAARFGWPQIATVINDVTAIAMGGVLIRLSGIIVFRVVVPSLRITAPRIVHDLTVTLVFIAWVLLWLRMSGMDLASIVTTSAVLTGIIAFAMQETLGNILGGLALQLDNSVRIGDWVKVDDVSGRVVEVRWRFTAVETRNRETVIIPNSYLMKNRFMVIGSRADPELRWRRTVFLNVSLDANPMRVCQVLERAIRNAEISFVARDPAPSVVLMDFTLGAGHYAVRYWLTDARLDDPTDSLVRAHAHAALARHGMRVAVPQEERLIVKENEAYQAAQHAVETARRIAALKTVEIFRPLSDAEFASLADHLIPAPFVAGATMTHQGDVAHWLYLIIDGEADVWAESRQGQRNYIATLKSGSVFGEMGMMTGEPRSATVTAKTDVDCYRLDKAGFEQIIRARPDITTEISQVLSTRAAELAQLRAAHEGAQRPVAKNSEILKRIRAFFALD